MRCKVQFCVFRWASNFEQKNIISGSRLILEAMILAAYADRKPVTSVLDHLLLGFRLLPAFHLANAYAVDSLGLLEERMDFWDELDETVLAVDEHKRVKWKSVSNAPEKL